jgi:hypothetical protein
MVRGKIRITIVFHDTQKVCEIQISVSINKILLEHSHTHPFMDATARLAELNRCNEAVGPAKAKIFTMKLLTEKVCQPLI